MTASSVTKDFPIVCSGIKEVGGITISQKLETATHQNMSERAIESGCIDFILSPEDITKEIKRIANTGKKQIQG